MEEKDMNIKLENEPSDNNIENNTINNVSEEHALPVSDRHHSSDHHHHHHHHHHRHHHKKRKNSNKKSEKLKAFLKKYNKRIINILVASALVFSLLIIAVALDSDDAGDPSKNSAPEITNTPVNTLQIEVPLFSEDVIIVGDGVVLYMESDISVGCDEIYKQLINKYGRLDVGASVPISYNIIGMPEDCFVRSAAVYVADNDDFENAAVYKLNHNETTVYVSNLFTDTKYYYKISVTLSNDTTTSVEGNFKTADTPRVLSIEGGYNIRDIGGWDTVDGKTIKQGLLYRGCEIDGGVEEQYTLTSNGINTMLTVLGIRTDMDLRASDTNNGAYILGSSVEHKYYSVKGETNYVAIFGDNPEIKTAVRDIFSDLADETNYPVYLHCTYGTDRTGTICYLLGALLGMSEDDLMRDYQLSALHHGIVSESMDIYVNAFKALEGDTLQEKAEGYLLSIGVTEEEIANIKRIFLE